MTRDLCPDTEAQDGSEGGISGMMDARRKIPTLARATGKPRSQPSSLGDDGDNHSDRQQPYNANDLRAYQDGYKQGFRNTASAPKAPVTASAPKKQGRAIRFWRTRRT